MTMNQLESVLKTLGVKEIDALGKSFDPIFHHAIQRIEKSDVEENIIIEVFQKGFMLKNQVIRFAKVKVAK